MRYSFCIAAFAFWVLPTSAFASTTENVKLVVDKNNNVSAATLVQYTMPGGQPYSCAVAREMCLSSCNPAIQPAVNECMRHCRSDDYECASYCYDVGVAACENDCFYETYANCVV